MTQPPLGGAVAPAFGAVEERFAELLADGSETGAAVAVYRGNELVVDLWGGWVDSSRTEPWRRDTIVPTYSVTKVPTAVTVLALVDRGLIGLDDMVTSVWPEYAAAGKASTTVRMLLAHQAGLPAFPELRGPHAWSDWDDLTGMLAAAAPEWEPGDAHGEHALTYGHLLGEVVRRVTGRSLGTVWREEVATPLGLDFHIGLRGADAERVAEMEYATATWPELTLGTPGSLRQRALGNPTGALDLSVLGSSLWRETEVPAVNGHGTARAVARLYAGLAGWLEESLLAEDLRAELFRAVCTGPDLLLERSVAWGLGLQLEDGYAGMGGIGGSDGMVHRGHGYAFGYVTRRLRNHARATALADAVETCLLSS